MPLTQYTEHPIRIVTASDDAVIKDWFYDIEAYADKRRLLSDIEDAIRSGHTVVITRSDKLEPICDQLARRLPLIKEKAIEETKWWELENERTKRK